jgi:hypothetical protein
MNKQIVLLSANLFIVLLFGFSVQEKPVKQILFTTSTNLETIISALTKTITSQPTEVNSLVPIKTDTYASNTTPKVPAPFIIGTDTANPFTPTINDLNQPFDWSLRIAFGSLLLSVITLYLAHLRGPNINIAVPDHIYPIHGLITQTMRNPPKADIAGHYVIVSNLLIANTGISSGILYSFRIDPDDKAVFYYELDPNPDRELPITIPPGEGWQTRLSVQISSGQKSWLEFVEGKKTINMKVEYLVSASFGRKRQKKAELKINLVPLAASIQAAKSNQQ